MELLKVIEQAVEGLGYELVDFETSPRARLLRVFIDSPKGVAIEDCTKVYFVASNTESRFEPTINIMKRQALGSTSPIGIASNTIIGVIATNAKLDKEECNKVAQMAQDGIARTINPAHTMYDGDTLFCLATGQVPENVNLIGALAAEVTAQAIIRAAITACSAGGLPGFTQGLE